MALSNQVKNLYAICTCLLMLKVTLTKPGLIYSEKEELDHLPSISDALQLQAMRANYQSKAWLYADKHCVQSFAGSP